MAECRKTVHDRVHLLAWSGPHHRPEWQRQPLDEFGGQIAVKLQGVDSCNGTHFDDLLDRRVDEKSNGFHVGEERAHLFDANPRLLGRDIPLRNREVEADMRCPRLGGSEQVALMSGINVARTKIFIYLMSGTYAAIAGFLLSGRVISGQPLLGSGDLLLQSIGAVIIGGTSIFGGRGGVLRTVLGVLVIAFMVNGLNLLAISTFTQQVIVSAIIILSAWANAFRRGAG